MEQFNDFDARNGQHIYGTTCAAYIYIGRDKEQQPKVFIDTAGKENDQYHWKAKLSQSLSIGEVSALTCTVLGWQTKAEFKNRGSARNKSLMMAHQGGNLLLQTGLYTTSKHFYHRIPINAGDAFLLAGLFVQWLRIIQPHLDATSVLTLLKNTAGRMAAIEAG